MREPIELALPELLGGHHDHHPWTAPAIGATEYGVFLGLDVGKGEHHAVGLAPDGKRLHDAPLPNAEARPRALFGRLARHGTLLVVVDQPASIGADDLAGESTRVSNRIRGPLTQLHPPLEAVLGREIAHPAVLELLSRCGAPSLREVPRQRAEVAAEVKRMLDPHPLARVTFPTPGHLAAHAGLAPVTRRSGSSIRGDHPPKGGNKQLKRAFFLAAHASLSHPPSRAYHDRKRAEGKKHNAALICLARRRVDVLHAVLRDRALYRAPTAQPDTQAA